MHSALHRRPALLPDLPLSGTGPLAMLCAMNALTTLREAAAYVQGLPYGRNHRRDEPALVLVEGLGTCSSKHAFLAELASENGAELGLTLGVYRMSAESDPPVAGVLAASGVDWLPEAHCYLTVSDVRVDLTGPGEERSLDLLHEELITPDQVIEYKPMVHRRFIEARAEALGVPVEALWAIREACIEALTAPTDRSCTPARRGR